MRVYAAVRLGRASAAAVCACAATGGDLHASTMAVATAEVVGATIDVWRGLAVPQWGIVLLLWWTCPRNLGVFTELVADARKRTLQNEWKVTSDGLHAMKASSVDASDFLTMDPPSGTWPRFRQARDFAREFTNMVVAWKQQKMMEVEYCGDVNPTTRPSSIEIVEKMELEQCEAPSTGVRVSL